MDDDQICPKCGAPLPADVAPGHCPKCLMQVGFESRDQVATDPAEAPTDVSGLNGETWDLDQLASLFPELEIIKQVGVGGMGVVYQARQKQLDRFVAVKLVRPDLCDDPAFAERFTREARAMARLSHPAIINVFDFGQREQFYFFIMEFVDGTNLRQLLQSEGLDTNRHWRSFRRSAKHFSTLTTKASFIATSSRRTFLSTRRDASRSLISVWQN
ncbi:MAG: protein kinase [Fuerstiella sp.]|nr:protein kinase [Fuerstiella sp.]MCP4853153.1 protein kinase [Fuerstiella sp.]